MHLSDDVLDIMKRGRALPSVQICVDGPNAQVVDATSRIPGSFDRIIRGVKLVKKHGVLLQVGMVVDAAEKLDLIEPTLLLAKELGADRFVPTPAINFGRAKGRFFFDEKTTSRFVSLCEEMRRRHGSFFGQEGKAFDPTTSSGCGAGLRTLTVNWTGRCKICTMQPADWYSFGDILELDSPEFQARFVGFSNLRSPTVETCHGCPHLQYCMNCCVRAISLVRSGKIRFEDCQWCCTNAELLDQLGFQWGTNGPEGPGTDTSSRS